MTVRRLRRLLPAALAALAVVVWLPSAAHARPTPEEYAGINIQKLIFEMPATSWFAHFNAMESAGIQLVRFDALWQRLEPEPPVDGRHAYRWDRFDPIVGALAQRGIRWLPIIGYATRWSATSTAHYAAPPRSPAEYAEYAGAIATRYGSNGTYWREHPEIQPLPVSDYEVWNAPNNPAHYYPRPDPAHYADMYLAAREAIRAADPPADVWVGGLAGVGAPEFMDAMYTARPQLLGQVDAVAIHPYDDDPARVTRLVLALRTFLDGVGEGAVGIPITEIGWASRGQGSGRQISDELRAVYLTELTGQFGRSDCGVWTFMPHTWTTRERNLVSAGEWFGLWGPADAAPNASGRAYQATLGALVRTRRADLPLCDRPLNVSVSTSSQSVTRVVARRSSPTERTTRARRRHRRTCHTAQVTVANDPLVGATVQFEYFERRRGRRRARIITRTSGSDGIAYVCRTRPAGRRAGRPLFLRRVTASHQDLVHGAATVRRLRLP